MLPQNHAIKSLLERRHAPNSQPHCLSLENMTSKQQQKIKSSIVDANNHLNRVFPFFDSLNRKFLPELRLIDIFSSYISFHQADHCSNKSKTTYCNKLNELIFKSLSELSTVIVVLDTSIRNNVATSIAHIHFFNNPLKKTIMSSISHQQRQNYLLLDVGLIRWSKYLGLLTLLSLWMPFMQHKILTPLYILINFN